MSSGASNPFVEIEAALASPGATGVFLTALEEGRPLSAAGARPGDIITAVGDTEVSDSQAYFQAVQPAGEDDQKRSMTLYHADGTTTVVDVEIPLTGYSWCIVKAGKAAWTPKDDTFTEPDLSWLGDGTEIWLRCSFGDEPAGFERLLVTRDGDRLLVDNLFRIGGVTPDGETWDYRTREESAHGRDRWLSVVRTAFWEGPPDGEAPRGDVSLGDDGRWTGTRFNPDGSEHEVTFKAVCTRSNTPYGCMLIPLVMPLEEGASLTVCLAGDGTAVSASRTRFECTGRETVRVDGQDVEAWCFRWLRYGERGDDELFYVSDDRRLVRIDWGEDYGGCWAELVDKDDVLKGVPEHVTMA